MTALKHAHELVEKIDDRQLRNACRAALNVNATPETQVAALHEMWNLPIRVEPHMLSVTDRERRLRLHLEEFLELVKASGFTIGADPEHVFDFADIGSVLQLTHVEGSRQNPVEMMDALADLRTVDTGMALEMGLSIAHAMMEVTASNMTKMGADGKPIVNGVTEGYRGPFSLRHGCEIFEAESGYQPDAPVGKILKGPNYMPPDLATALGLKYKMENL